MALAGDMAGEPETGDSKPGAEGAPGYSGGG